MKGGKQVKEKNSIKCECGAVILLVPDLTELGHSIEAHAATHAKIIKNPRKAEEEYSRIQELLIRKVFQKVGNSESQTDIRVI
jgi:hypothetical protein